MRRSAHLLASAALVLCAVGCDESLQDFAGLTPNLEPTFSSIQRDILTTADSSGRPACTMCHNPVDALVSGGMNLSGANAYNALVNAASTGKPGAVCVIPGDPDGSYLIQKLEGTQGIVGDRMPRFGPYLTPGQIAVIRRWIELGAANN